MIEELSSTEMAVKLGVSERTVNRWIKDGRVQARLLKNHKYAVDTEHLLSLAVPEHSTAMYDRITTIEQHLEQLHTVFAAFMRKTEQELYDIRESHLPALDIRLDTLAREIEFEDDLSDRVDALAEQVQKLASQIQELQEIALQPRRIGNKPHKEAESTHDTLPISKASKTANKTVLSGDDNQQTTELPDNLVGAIAFAKQHNIPETTIRKAIAKGRLPTVKGRWKVGKAIVHMALDEQGRQRFFELYPHTLTQP